MASIIFMGTSEFSAKSLKALNNDHEIVLVATKPDKIGRKKTIEPSPVKVLANSLNLKVIQPENLKNEEIFKFLSNIKPDFIIVVAYGKILPLNILKIPKFGCINVHGSILPAYRGSSPIQYAILNGEKSTGITIMKMDPGIDTGDILFQESTEILENETSSELTIRLATIGSRLLISSISKILESGGMSKFRIKQNDELATYSYIIKKDHGIINWTENATKILNFIRAMNSWPVAYTFLNGKILKIYKAKLANLDDFSSKPGKILIQNKKVIVACGNGAIELLEVQNEGKKCITALQFVCGLRSAKELIHYHFS
ncbi:MAG: methionyl-tRNA formyltransferase [Oscillospiraceae bacterium]|jgi:methionyl-tRNA formyltransferase|nr:methionyl-tRNA formyltransferase [Oscillospiraceae bacterium]